MYSELLCKESFAGCEDLPDRGYGEAQPRSIDIFEAVGIFIACKLHPSLFAVWLCWP